MLAPRTPNDAHTYKIFLADNEGATHTLDSRRCFSNNQSYWTFCELSCVYVGASRASSHTNKHCEFIGLNKDDTGHIYVGRYYTAPQHHTFTQHSTGKVKMFFAADNGGILCQDLVATQVFLQPMVAANLLWR